MSYIGPAPNPGQNREVDDISSSFNGSTTAFTLQVNSQNVSPGSSNNIIVSLGGVVQNPSTDYNIAASTITFTTAPASGLSFFGLVLGQQIDTQSLADGASPTMAAPTITGDLSIADKIVHTGDTNTAIRFPAADTITAETGGSERLRVDSSGRLLIGHTTSLAAANAQFSFQVLGTSFATTSVTQQRYAADVSGPSIILAKSRGSLGNHTIVQSGDELGKIRFYGSDGTDFNNYGAHIICNVDAAPGSNDMPGRLVFGTTADGAGSPTERMRIDKDGNVLVSTTSTTINSSNFGIGLFADHGVAIFKDTTGPNTVVRMGGNQGLVKVQGDGDLFNTNNTYGQASDETLKQDIVDAASQWNDIKNLRVRKFRFKDNPTGVLQIGVVAQETEKVSAGLVQEDSDGIKSVKYSVLYMKAIKCLQEAQAKIETLETKVAALEAA